MVDYIDFREELADLINRRSMENGSNTQDFVLANYLTACLIAFDNAVTERDRLTAPTPNPTKKGGSV